MPRHATGHTAVAAMLASCFAAHAQSLAEPAPVPRVLKVVQFGVPQDAKYIFCDAAQCPERTIKTLAAPVLAPVPKPIAQVAPQPLPQVQSVVVPPPELSPPKAVEADAQTAKKKPKRRKRAVKLDCRPVTAQ